MNYWYLLDLYRNVPLVTEDSAIGEKVLPSQVTPQELYDFIETELTECVDDMLDPVVGYSQQYGHANKAAAWSLLSRLYLNAKVYIGQEKYTECIDACKKVIASGYTLDPEYKAIFCADNDHSI